MQNWETLVGWLDSEGLASDLTHSRWLDRLSVKKTSAISRCPGELDANPQRG